MNEKQRYSILRLSADQVRAIGGQDVKELPRLGIVFANLTDAQVARLKAAGASVSPVGQIKAQVIAPPKVVPAEAKYSPSSLVWAVLRPAGGPGGEAGGCPASR